jgi:TnpA family transposase
VIGTIFSLGIAPEAARCISSHYGFDLLYNNTTEIQPSIHSTDTHGTNKVNFAILAFFGYQFAPRYKDIRGKMGTLYGFKHPSQYDKESLFKPASKANTKLILAEEDIIQHILASFPLKVTRQSVIIANGRVARPVNTSRTFVLNSSAWRSSCLRHRRPLISSVKKLTKVRRILESLECDTDTLTRALASR